VSEAEVLWAKLASRNYDWLGVRRDAFLRMVKGDPVTLLHSSGVWKMRLVLDGRSAEEQFVVRRLPRLL
jgi:hypothetical protein